MEKREIKNNIKTPEAPSGNQKPKVTIPQYKEIKMVKGKFKNLESSGLGISFPFRGHWMGPVRQFTLFDGVETHIPEEVANHLNEKCAYIKYKWVSSDGTEVCNAKPVTTSAMPDFKPEVEKKDSRFLFQITG